MSFVNLAVEYKSISIAWLPGDPNKQKQEAI